MKTNFLFLNRLKLALVLFLFLSVVAVQKSYAQNAVQISGTVTSSSDKLPLPGVNILEKGTENGVSADFDGNFKFTVKSGNATLVLTYMGYKTKEVELKGKTTINIELEEIQQTLEEVVVVGYGSVKKSDLTGSVATISGADLKKQPITNIAEALTGRLAGVRVTSSEGSPDSDINIRIRGGGSLTQDGSPLLIVDGFPVNSINDISPSDVETVTVLKDASSTAIYGSRGANGVILITTKSGKAGEKVSVSYDMFTGFKSIAETIDVLSPADYAKWQYEFAVMNNDIDSYEDYFGPYDQIGKYDNVRGTNWQKEIYGRTGAVQNHNLSIRGGSDKLSYNFNYVRYDEEAIMIGSNFKRDNVSLNLKSKLSDKVDVNFTMRYSRTKVTGGGANEQKEFSSTDSRLKHVIGYAPIPLDGITTDDTDEALAGYLVNPFVALADNDRNQDRRNYNMLGGLNWKITKSLQFKSDFGIDFYRYLDNRFFGRTTYYVNNMPAPENQGLPALIMSNRDDSKFRNANTLNYDFRKSLGEDHKLKVLVGEEMIIYKSNILTNTIHGYPKLFSFENAQNLTTVGTPFSVNNFNNPQDKLLSFFGRINYDYKDRYLFTATYRADGSSIFLGDNRWGYFPSAAVAWKISEESFLKDNASWLDLLKVRVSYGQAGNNNIPPGQTIRTFQSSNSAWINGTENYWATPSIMPNPDLKWETTTTKNVGLDFELLRGRISGSFEAYDNKTDDLLLSFITPGSGYDSQYRNMGQTENKGFEATLNYSPIRKQNYGLDLSFNIAFNKNNINSLGTMNDFEYGTQWASAITNDYAVHVNQSIGAMFGYQNDGRYEVSDFNYSGGVYTLKEGVVNSSIVGNVQPGTMKLKDINGDGVVDANDRTIIGNANPKHTGGFVLNARAHNFDLSAAFNWSFGNDVYNASKIEHTTTTISSPSGQYRNLMSTMADGTRWTNIDPATGQLASDPETLAALNANTTMWSPSMARFVMSDWAIEDGSFLRLNTLTLGYSMPDDFVKKLGLSRFRLYGTATNVFVITNYSGLDPEVSTRRKTPLTPGTDYSPYPRNRQFVFGINLNF